MYYSREHLFQSQTRSRFRLFLKHFLMMINSKIINRAKTPETFEELINSLNSIVGKSVSELARSAGIPLPISTTHGKGFTGELLEILLGASAENRPIPDFPKLGLELKTLPVDSNLVPLESTFLCHAPLTGIRHLTFENSTLYSKIKRVLFVVVTAQRDMDFEDRIIAGYFFFTPDKFQYSQIKRDYNELYEMIKTGNVEKISARIGQIIQLRPKCANGRALTDCIGPDGEFIKTRPRGFYMRRNFTKSLIEEKLKQQQATDSKTV